MYLTTTSFVNYFFTTNSQLFTTYFHIPKNAFFDCELDFNAFLFQISNMPTVLISYTQTDNH